MNLTYDVFTRMSMPELIDKGREVISQLGTTNWYVMMFPQWWSSTACGFPGIGGQAITEAMTVIVANKDFAYVCINGRHAYTLEMSIPDHRQLYDIILETREAPGLAYLLMTLESMNKAGQEDPVPEEAM